MKFTIAATLALFASASAFAPAAPAFGVASRASSSLRMADGDFVWGKYEGQLWSNDAKKEIYAAWDPNAARSTLNFNPFENNKDGNSPDCSGFYPGEGRFKDPTRPDIDFATMMSERTEAEERAANPKAGDVKGAPGCLQGMNAMK